jgi:hypothetical protein
LSNLFPLLEHGVFSRIDAVHRKLPEDAGGVKHEAVEGVRGAIYDLLLDRKSVSERLFSVSSVHLW